MRTQYWIGATILALIAGAAIGWFTAGARPDGAAARPVAPPANTDVSPTASDHSPLAATPDRPRNAISTPPGGGAALADSLREIALPELARGDGRVVVLVEDEHGKPVEGVELKLRQPVDHDLIKLPARTDYDTDEEYIEARIRREYVRLKLELQATLTQSSDSQGRIEFSGLVSEHLTLSGNPKGYLIEGRFRTMSRPVKIGDEVTVMVSRALAVTVAATDSTGSGVVNCKLSWTCPEMRERAGSVTMSLGREKEVMVLPGTYSFVASSDDPALRSETLTVEVREAPVSLTLDLTPGKLLTGKVTFVDARPNHWNVLVAKVIAGADDHELLQDSGTNSVIHMNLDANGRFVARDELQGEHVIGVVVGRQVLASTRATLGLAPVHVELEVPTPSGDTLCVVNIEVPKKPPAGILSFHVRDDNSAKFLSPEIWKYSETRYLLVFNLRENERMFSSAKLFAASYSLGSVQVNYRPGVDRELSLKFEPPTKVRLTIEGLPGSIARPDIQIARGPAFDQWQTVHAPFRNGEADIGGWQPGTYRFRVNGGSHNSWPWLEVDQTIEAGDRTVALKVPQLYGIKLDGSGCSPYPHADLKHVGLGMSIHFTFDDDGVAIITPLPAGEYEVSYTSGGIHGKKQTVKFQLPDQETVVLTGD